MNKRGQSMMEYVLIAVLVILGIVIMGPYVLRSVNAHFKLWDYSVKDSFEETPTQASVNEIPTINITCSCPESRGSCGTPFGQDCGPGFREHDYNCTPQHCNGAQGDFYCEQDNSCCTDWEDRGCGNFTCPAGGCSGAPTSPPPASNNCYYGQELQGHPCGTDTSIRCVSCAQPSGCEGNPTGCPLPSCQGNPTPGAIACPNATTDLDKDYNITYVANQAACTGAKCQYYGGYTTFTLHVAQYVACRYCENNVPPIGTFCQEPFISQFTPYGQCGISPPNQPPFQFTYSACTEDASDLAWNCGTCMQETLASGQGCPHGIASVVSRQPGTVNYGNCATGTPGTEDDVYTVICNP